MTDGADAGVLGALRRAAEGQGVDVEIVAPTVAGVTTADGSTVAADQKVDGAPSVLYDAVAILADADGATRLSALPPARDFLSDAFAHCKFIGYSGPARSLFEAVGLGDKVDGGFVELGDDGAVGTFLQSCAQLRCWAREAALA